MAIQQNNDICEFLKKKFKADSINKIFSNPDVYDVYIKDKGVSYCDYDFNLIYRYGDDRNETWEQYVNINGNILVLPRVKKDETKEQYEQRVFSNSLPDIIYSRNRYDILVDKDGTLLSKKKYRFVGSSYCIIIRAAKDDEDNSVRVSVVRSCSEKFGLIDESCTEIFPTICDSISLHDSCAWCDITIKGKESTCYFEAPTTFYALLNNYDKDKLIAALNELDEADEWIIQYDIFNALGLVILSRDCISIFKCSDTKIEKIWPWIKDNVDNSRLLTKENTLKIINSFDWSTRSSVENVE